MARVLFHIDLNAFFASAEELRHPEYKGKPLAVGSASARGVLATANYEARKAGVHSAMPVAQARALCPDLVILEADHAYYRQLSSRFFSLLKTYTPKLEPVSIDECYMDVTEVIAKYPRPLDLAVEMQQKVYSELGLSCSVGVAPNRFLAKMASDMKKPMGISVLRRSEIENKLWKLGIENMIGVGESTRKKLSEAGIQTIGDLADPANEQKILKLLQRSGYDLIQKARGRSSDQLNYSTTQKSVSISRTYPSDFYTLDEVLPALRQLAEKLSSKMKQEQQKGKLVSLILRDVTFRNQMRSMSLDTWTDSAEVIYEAVSNLAAENFEPVGYRHLGISVGSLKDAASVFEQPTIFEPAIRTSQDIIAALNKSLGENAFKKASDLLDQEKE